MYRNSCKHRSTVKCVLRREWNGTSWSKEYVWLGSTLLATIEGSTIKYHHADHLSIRATTFADGMVGEEQGHYPFGEPWYETSPETTRIFTTYERDAGGALDYAMFRWMGPESGRFLSADPLHGSLGDGQSWNRYAYAGNDPVNRWDPWGLTDAEVTVWGPAPPISKVRHAPHPMFDLFGWLFFFPDWQMDRLSPDISRFRRLPHGNRTPDSQSECGTIVRFIVSAGRLEVYPEHGAPYIMSATSGRGPIAMNNPSASDQEDVGPIPGGRYIINSSQISVPSVAEKLNLNLRYGDWGDWNVGLQPTSTGSRSGFYLHCGALPGSAGCIDVGGGWFGDAASDQLLNDLLLDQDGTICVEVE